MSDKPLKALAYKDKVSLSDISASGNRNGDTFLSGDGTFKSPPSGMDAAIYDPNGIKEDVYSLEFAKETADFKKFTAVNKQKLSGIETEATKNLKDADLLDRKNHTGKQPISSVEDLDLKLKDKFSKTNKPKLEDVSELVATISAIEEKITNLVSGTVKRIKEALSLEEKLVVLENIGALPHPMGSKNQIVLGDGTVSELNKSLVGLGKVDNTSDDEKPISALTKKHLDRKISDEGGTLLGQIFRDLNPKSEWIRKGSFFSKILSVNRSAVFNTPAAFAAYAIQDKACFSPAVRFDYVQKDVDYLLEGSYSLGTVRISDGVEGVNPGRLTIQHQNANGHGWKSWSFSGITGEFSSYGSVVSPFNAVRIDHPSEPENFDLVLPSVISNDTLIVIRGKSKLVGGSVIVDVEKHLGFKKNTLKGLWKEPVVSSVLGQSFDRIKVEPFSGTSFKIVSENSSSVEEISWLVTASRNDALIKHDQFDRTDINGKIKNEVEKMP